MSIQNFKDVETGLVLLLNQLIEKKQEKSITSIY